VHGYGSTHHPHRGRLGQQGGDGGGDAPEGPLRAQVRRADREVDAGERRAPEGNDVDPCGPCGDLGGDDDDAGGRSDQRRRPPSAAARLVGPLPSQAQLDQLLDERDPGAARQPQRVADLDLPHFAALVQEA
jgi:hypothetical protein